MDISEYYRDQPREVSIETLSLCNARCTFCPYPTLERKGEKMSDELIEKIISEMSSFKVPFIFSPFKVNEPLLDPRLPHICKEVLERTLAEVRIFTNGAPLVQKHIDWIADLPRIHHLWISLNSVIPEEYERIMGIPFERTARNLDRLHAQDFPHQVVLSAVGFPNNHFADYCSKRWPNFGVFVIKQDSWLGFTDAHRDQVPDTSCPRWEELSIMSNGIVSLCCMDSDGEYAIGDVNKQTLLEVYNSDHYRERRVSNLSRRVVDVCRTCTY